MVKILKYTLTSLFFALLPGAAFAFHRPATPVHLVKGVDVKKIFELPSQNEAGGHSVSIADLGEDGTPEVIIGAGLGNEPRVSVLRGDGSLIGDFLAYLPQMGVGINVAACDLDGDSISEIVTAPQRGGGPHVRVFSHEGEVAHDGFFAYTEVFRGGVNLACGDLDDDGRAELVTMPATGGGPHVRIWEMRSNEMILKQELFAFGAEDNRGLVGVVHDGQLILSNQRASDAHIKTYELQSPPILVDEQVFPLSANGIGSLFVQNGKLKMTTTSESTIYDVETGTALSVDSPFGSIVADAGDFDGDGYEEVIVVPSRPFFAENKGPKSIVVDISDQRIYAYEYGILTNSYLVSTARGGYWTPRGEHSVLAKVPEVYYAWSYGEGNAENYDLGLVPWNLRIFPHIYIHYAPWHNNFGHPMSHGCINVSLENILWTYDWAEEGIPVTVRD